MKKYKAILLVFLVIFLLTACSNTVKTRTTESSTTINENEDNSDGEQAVDNDNSTIRMATDDAQMQKSDASMPTRVIENGTKINMHFGDTVIPGILNDSETAQALIEMLPYTVHMNRYSHDFCGVMNDPLLYSEENVHYGWLNGDIDFATNADYFTILFEDEENSQQYGDQVNIGVIDCELSKISDLQGSHDVLIELAE